jgi:beta-lactamase superfamily II metal-dependent hydrolase
MGAIDVDGLAASAVSEAAAEPNGSSIAILVEFEGKRVLLGADAHPGVLLQALKLLDGGAPAPLHAFKIPHHGSAHNTSDALLQAVTCDRWLVSSNGSYFKHPDRSAVARVIKQAKGKREIYFNYRSDFSEVWDDPAMRAKFAYSTVYPRPDSPGHMALDL